MAIIVHIGVARKASSLVALIGGISSHVPIATIPVVVRCAVSVPPVWIPITIGIVVVRRLRGRGPRRGVIAQRGRPLDRIRDRAGSGKDQHANSDGSHYYGLSLHRYSPRFNECQTRPTQRGKSMSLPYPVTVRVATGTRDRGTAQRREVITEPGKVTL